MDLNEVLHRVETGTSGTEHANWLRDTLQINSKHPDWAIAFGRHALDEVDEARAEAKKWRADYLQLRCLRTKYLATLMSEPREIAEARAWAIRMKQERDKLIQSRAIVKDALAGATGQFWEVWQERDKLQAELACQANMLSSEKAAYQSASERAAKLQAELEEVKADWRAGRKLVHDAGFVNTIDILQEIQTRGMAVEGLRRRNKELQAELKARDERKCETCQYWETCADSNCCGYCGWHDDHYWGPDAFCSEWEAKLQEGG